MSYHLSYSHQSCLKNKIKTNKQTKKGYSASVNTCLAHERFCGSIPSTGKKKKKRQDLTTFTQAGLELKTLPPIAGIISMLPSPPYCFPLSMTNAWYLSTFIPSREIWGGRETSIY
jgi:hypothetical protein